jgi:preprotein translocase subunit YajC
MRKNKFAEKELRDAIIMAFGSIDEYAKKTNVARANIYQKIERQSSKFLKELKDNGVVINSGGQIGKMDANNNKGTINISANNEIEKLKNEIEKQNNEIEMLKELIKAKDKVIQLLENK